MLSCSIRLPGLPGEAPGLPGPLLRDLMDAVDRGARGAVRLRLEGRSTAGAGPDPGWVSAAACFSVVGLTEGVALRIADDGKLDYVTGLVHQSYRRNADAQTR